MKNLLFAAWKNSSQPKIGQFEYIKTSDENEKKAVRILDELMSKENKEGEKGVEVGEKGCRE